MIRKVITIYTEKQFTCLNEYAADFVKNENGVERKIYEIDANAVELISATPGTRAISSSTTSNEEIVKFSQEEFTDELIGEDEIPF